VASALGQGILAPTSALQGAPRMALKRGLFWPVYALYGVTASALTIYLLYAPVPPGGRNLRWAVPALLLAPALPVWMVLYVPLGGHPGPPAEVAALITISGCLATPLLIAWVVAWLRKPTDLRHERRFDKHYDRRSPRGRP